MEKTIREWLSELPEPYRSLALKNYELLNDEMDLQIKEDTPEKDMRGALSGAYVWEQTKEGYDFWHKVSLHYRSYPLPELPNNNKL